MGLEGECLCDMQESAQVTVRLSSHTKPFSAGCYVRSGARLLSTHRQIVQLFLTRDHWLRFFPGPNRRLAGMARPWLTRVDTDGVTLGASRPGSVGHKGGMVAVVTIGIVLSTVLSDLCHVLLRDTSSSESTPGFRTGARLKLDIDPHAQPLAAYQRPLHPGWH